MADLYGPLFEHLKANAAVAALVVDRIFHLRADEGTALPFVVIQGLSEDPEGEHATGHDGLVRAVYQISTYGIEITAARAVADAVRLSLQMLRTTLGAAGVTEPAMQLCTAGGLRDVDIPPTQGKDQGSDQGIAGVQRDFEFWYRETPP